jgi:hypothetical protein
VQDILKETSSENLLVEIIEEHLHFHQNRFRLPRCALMIVESYNNWNWIRINNTSVQHHFNTVTILKALKELSSQLPTLLWRKSHLSSDDVINDESSW